MEWMYWIDSRAEGTALGHPGTVPAVSGVLRLEKFGGPCRGRTYGPLIKSESNGFAQVLEDLGNPSFFNHIVNFVVV